MDNLEDNYTKKELVINAWLLSYDLSNSDISDLAGCSYEYARRLVENLENGELNATHFEDEDLQSALEDKLQAIQMGLPDFDNQSEDLSTDRGSIDIIGESDKEISDGLEDLIHGNEPSEPSEESDQVDREYLQRCLDEINSYYREANFHMENGEQWALWQYYLSVRAHQLLGRVLEEYDGSIPNEEIEKIANTFKEFYYEANFEEEHNLKGAKQKKFTSLRIHEMLQVVVEDES